MRTNRLLLAVLALVALFLVAVTRLVNLAFSRAPIYQEHSTLRSDPLGAKALFETLSALPGLTVERNIRRTSRLAGVEATVFWLGEDPYGPRSWSKPELAAFESITQRGGRLVIGILPAGPLYEMSTPDDPKKDSQKQASDAKKKIKEILERMTPEIEKRWGLQVERDIAKKWSESDNGARRETSVWIKPLAPAWQCLAEHNGRCLAAERAFGKGSIVFTTDTFPLSNEGLRDDRRPQWIAQLVGPWKRVIFDEAHLGVEDAGSIGTLIRQFRLEAAALMLVALAALFIWRNSTSFLPVRPPVPDAALLGDPHRSLTLLLRRSIARSALIDSCLEEWRRARTLLPYRQSRRLDEAAGAAHAGGSPLQAWQRVRQTLQEKS